MRFPVTSKEHLARTYDQNYYEGGSKRTALHYDFEEMRRMFHPPARVFARIGARRALDVGCASGPLVSALLEEGVDAYGIDVSQYAIERSPVRERLRWVDILSEPFPFPDQSFDFVTSIETLEHLHEVDRVLREIHRVLRPGGLCYIAAPVTNQWPNYDETHVTILSRAQWAGRLCAAGLRPPRRRRTEVMRTVYATYREMLRKDQLPRPLRSVKGLGRTLLAGYIAFLNWSQGMIWATGRRHAHVLAQRTV